MFFRLCYVALFVCLMAAPSKSWTEPQAATPKPQLHRLEVALKYLPKAQRKPIPFELVKGALIFESKVNGQKVLALLDNGAATTIIDKQFASDHKIVTGPVVAPLVTSTGTLERRIAMNLSIELPNQVTLTAPASVADLRFVAMGIGRPIAMVLGREYFANMVFAILPSRGTFEVGPTGSLIIPATIPFATIDDDNARIEVDVAGRKLKLLVDLGANEQIVLSATAWTRLGLDKAPQSKGWSAHADGKVYEVVNAQVPRATFGPFARENVRVSRRTAIAHGVDGYVGLGFLANFNFAIDVKQRKLWMLGPVKRTLAPGETAR